MPGSSGDVSKPSEASNLEFESGRENFSHYHQSVNFIICPATRGSPFARKARLAQCSSYCHDFVFSMGERESQDRAPISRFCRPLRFILYQGLQTPPAALRASGFCSTRQRSINDRFFRPRIPTAPLCVRFPCQLPAHRAQVQVCPGPLLNGHSRSFWLHLIRLRARVSQNKTDKPTIPDFLKRLAARFRHVEIAGARSIC